jgi:hypothetical protein
MSLEGRSRGSGCEHSSVKQAPQAYHAPVWRKCTVDYICPPDWCHAIPDVASASELPDSH